MSDKQKTMYKWWLFALLLTLCFIVLQIPAAWIMAKFYPNSQSIENVEGNLWRGQAEWNKNNAQGMVRWTFRPWEIFLLRLGANVEISSAKSVIAGNMSYSIGKVVGFSGLNGQIDAATVSAFSPNLQFPTNPIQLKDISLKWNKKSTKISGAAGELNWGGGSVSYQNGPRTERLNLPPMQGFLLNDDATLQLAVKNMKQQRMADFALASDGMFEIQLTQRFLSYMAGYEGKAGQDSVVLSTRQPIKSLGGR